MTEQLPILFEKIVGLLNQISSLENEVSRLTDENHSLKEQLDSLTKRFSQSELPKNSQNSSRPPSSDFPKPQKTQSLREPSGKKPGGQSGHEGKTLKMTPNPDVIKQHSSYYCSCCGEDLSAQPSFFTGKRQVIDIPPIIPVVTERQIFDKRCKCGHLNRASYPACATSTVSYGENAQALIAYLSARQYLPIKRLSEFLSDMFGLSVSTGGVEYILNKMQSKASVVYESIRQNVLKNNVIGADETEVNINGSNNWGRTFQHPKATFIAIHPNRGYKAIKKIMPEGLQNNILVTDCWSSYFKTDAASHQLCTAHLLKGTHFSERKAQKPNMGNTNGTTNL